MLKITNEVACRYHIEFGQNKHYPDIYLGENKMEYVNTYKYLGEMFNHKGNAEEHLIQQKKKTEAAYQIILTIMGNQLFYNIELETAWKLLETCVQPIITYGGETCEMTKQEEKESTQYKTKLSEELSW